MNLERAVTGGTDTAAAAERQRGMRRGHLLVVWILLLIPVAPPCTRGATAELHPLYDGFGDRDSFDVSTSLSVGQVASEGRPADIALAVSFTVGPQQDYHLRAIDLALTAEGRGRAVDVRVLGNHQTRAQQGGSPRDSHVLEHFVVTPSSTTDQPGPPGPHSIVHLSSSSGPVLRAGGRYWLTISAAQPATNTLAHWWGAGPDSAHTHSLLATRRNLGPWQLGPATGRGLALRILASPVAPPASTKYAFTAIADSRGAFRRFPRSSTIEINHAGAILFDAELRDGTNGLFLRHGASLSSVARSDGARPAFSQLGDGASLNATGVAVWRGVLEDGTEGIFEQTKGTWRPVATDRGPLASFGPPAVNASGMVTFLAGLKGQGGGVFTARGGKIKAVAHTADPFAGFQHRPAINAKGVVAFAATLGNGVRGLYTKRGGLLTAIADTRGRFTAFGPPRINDRGTVAFMACVDPKQPTCPPNSTAAQGVFTGNGERVVSVADSSGPYHSFGHPALNNAGTVAFIATLDSGRIGVFTGPDPGRDRVIVTGDSLLGSRVTALELHDGIGLNDAGQIVFRARSEDGTEGIYLATPH